MNTKLQLIRDEGHVPHAYEDSKGYLTIGVGFLIDKRKGGRLPDEVCNFWLDVEIAERTNEIIKRFPKFTQLSRERQAVLITMAFNLGIAGLFNFKKMFAAIERGDFREAAWQILDSQAGRELATRYKRLARQMEFNEWI
jgi:lysozyme